MANLNSYRRELMLSLNMGLTKLYNRVHSRRDRDPDIEMLRNLHAELDRAVCDAYGWTDLDLAYSFHETDEGMRWTIAPPALLEILDRLLELNHQRHADELATGVAAPDARNGKTKRIGASKNISPKQLSLTDAI